MNMNGRKFKPQHEDFVEYCNELYASQHDSFQNFDFTSHS